MATAKKLDDDLLLDRLLAVFRRHGFEGASLSLISEATGLRRASLYYRFPEGKVAMARAVLEAVGRRFGEHVLEPLGEPGAPADRLRETARRLAEFYQDGTASCLLETLSLGKGDPQVQLLIAGSFRRWASAFAAVGQEAGLAEETALRRAEDAVARIEGALVMARATGDRQPFHRALEAFPEALTTP
jgi:AcrR family transcriptional regulator